AGRPLAHSSVITIMNIMHRKGFLSRKKDGKSFLFSPKVQKENVAGGIVGDVLSRMFDGDPAAMVLNLIDSAELDSDELNELRKLIARKAKESK
ncbi:BlaI/MecI/CopY family transcriptional regulator, partial [Planctomicrobium sp.]